LLAVSSPIASIEYDNKLGFAGEVGGRNIGSGIRNKGEDRRPLSFQF